MSNNGHTEEVTGVGALRTLIREHADEDRVSFGKITSSVERLATFQHKAAGALAVIILLFAAGIASLRWATKAAVTEVLIEHGVISLTRSAK